ncbi:sigma-70 family RNA polymerase sigma factor [Chloroflexota bacterium]
MYQEESLVKRAQKGDLEAFEQLYELHFNRIYRYMMIKLRNQMDAEDLTQQVFLKALRSISAYRWKGVPFSSWLFRIANNQVIDHFRKTNKVNVLPLDEGMIPSGDNPVLVAERRLRMEQLAAACEYLTEAQREVISLRFAGGLSVAETSETMGKSNGAVKVLQHEALVKLRRILCLNSEKANG